MKVDKTSTRIQNMKEKLKIKIPHDSRCLFLLLQAMLTNNTVFMYKINVCTVKEYNRRNDVSTV